MEKTTQAKAVDRNPVDTPRQTILDDDTPTRRMCRRKIFYSLCIGLPFVGVLLALLFAVGYPYWNQYMLWQEVHAISAEGFPATMEEVDQWSIRHKGKNGFAALEKFTKKFTICEKNFLLLVPKKYIAQGLTGYGDTEPYYGSAFQLADSPEVYRALETSVTPLRSELIKAKGYPVYRFDGTYPEKILETATKHWQTIVTMRDTLKTLTMWQVHEGRLSDALQTQAEMQTLIEFCNTEPCFIFLLVKNSLSKQMINTGITILQAENVTPHMLQRLHDQNPVFTDVELKLQQVMVVERLILAQTSQEEYTQAFFGSKPIDPDTVEGVYYYTIGFAADKRVALRYYDTMIQKLKNHSAESLLPLEVHFGAKLSESIIPATNGVILNALKTKARQRLLRAACMMKKDLLVGTPLPPMPGPVPGTMDPFSGKPLRIARATDGRIVLYSVGEDMEDNEEWKDGPPENFMYDIAIALHKAKEESR